jgi:hypothetical protein
VSASKKGMKDCRVIVTLRTPDGQPLDCRHLPKADPLPDYIVWNAGLFYLASTEQPAHPAMPGAAEYKQEVDVSFWTSLELGEPARRSTPPGGESPLPQFMRDAVTDFVEDVVDGVARRRDASAKLHEALVTIVSVIGARPEGVEIDRYAGWASLVASCALQGLPYPAQPMKSPL